MTDILVEKVLTAISGLDPAQKRAIAEAITSSAQTKLQLDLSAAAAKEDKILAEAASSSPELYARILSARGEARRIGVSVRDDNTIDVLELNKALDKLGWLPEKRMASKRILSIANMIP